MNVVESSAHALDGLDVAAVMRQRCAQVGLECAVPRLISAHPALAVRSMLIQVGNGNQRQPVLEIAMPCGEAKLLWMPWLPSQVPPSNAPGDYQHINYGAWAVMPRRTKCYGSAYAFSGQVHPVEKETPPEIAALYVTTSEIFGLRAPAVPNMCLENCYANGREYISEHSDDERQFGALRDVFCWSVGCARTAVFRAKQAQAQQPKTEVLTIELPAGLYVMQGRAFQRRYTHEFPQRHEALFKRLVRDLAKETDFPTRALSDRGASMTGLVQAAWIQERRGAAEAAIRRKPRRGKTVAEELRELDEWCGSRVSYTLRNFG